MTLSDDLRSELAAIAPKRGCCRLAEISALFHSAGSIHLRGRGAPVVDDRLPAGLHHILADVERRVADHDVHQQSFVGRGRALAEVMEDRYVQNRLSPEAQRRLLDRPEVIRAIGEGERAEAQAQVESS